MRHLGGEPTRLVPVTRRWILGISPDSGYGGTARDEFSFALYLVNIWFLSVSSTPISIQSQNKVSIARTHRFGACPEPALIMYKRVKEPTKDEAPASREVWNSPVLTRQWSRGYVDRFS
jgi:hypothetical protein